jgi:hypothetical protein
VNSKGLANFSICVIVFIAGGPRPPVSGPLAAASKPWRSDYWRIETLPLSKKPEHFSKQFLFRRVLDETACSSRRLFSQLILMEARKFDNRGGMTYAGRQSHPPFRAHCFRKEATGLESPG